MRFTSLASFFSFFSFTFSGSFDGFRVRLIAKLLAELQDKRLANVPTEKNSSKKAGGHLFEAPFSLHTFATNMPTAAAQSPAGGTASARVRAQRGLETCMPS